MVLSSPSPKTPLSSLTEADRAFLQALGAGPDPASNATAVPKERARSPASRSLEGQPSYHVAALLGDFDPTALMPGITERELGALLPECTVSHDGAESRWRLTTAARSRLLADMAQAGTLGTTRRTTQAWLKQTGQQTDAITDVLLELTGGKRPSSLEIAALGKASWAAYSAVLPALDHAGLLTERDGDAIRSSVGYAELLEPFRFLTGSDPSGKTDTFVGREKELERLRSFVDVLKAKSVTELVTRAAENVFGSDGRVLFLNGVGGVGKSTLAAKFMLQHAKHAGQNAWFRFAYLDFDRSTVHAAQPVTLLLEMIRQLGWQLPEARGSLDALRLRIDQLVGEAMARASRLAAPVERAASEMALPEEFVGPSELYQLVAAFAEAIDAGQSRKSVLLLVLDTFEEAQALGEEAVQRIERFLNLVVLQVGRGARILVIGRDEAHELLPDAPRMTLSQFNDVRSRRAFLERRGVDAAVSERVAKEAGGLPLALLLAARLVREHGDDAVALSLPQRLKAWLREGFTVGILYRRILDHIQDEDVRRVVHPGLVLRRLDPEVIRAIVVPVLGLADFDDARIDQAMEMLRRQKDLVRVQPDGGVTHRQDVRAQMIGLLAAEDPVLAQRLHAQAIDFYSRRQLQRDPREEVAQRDRVEELYHRLCLGEALDAVVERWIPRARLELARSLEEVTSELGQRALKVLLGRPLPDEEAATLPPALLRLFATRSVTVAAASHAPERALQVFDRFRDFLDPEVTALYHPLALDRAGRWPAAEAGYQRLLDDLSGPEEFLDAAPRPRAASERLFAVADFYERTRPGVDRGLTLLPRLASESRRMADRQDFSGSTALFRLWLRSYGGVDRLGHDRSVIDLFEAEFEGLGPCDVAWEVATSQTMRSEDRERVIRVPHTERTLQQIQFLLSLLHRPHERVDGETELRLRCESLLNQDSKLLRRSLRNLDFRSDPAAAAIVRHVLRPATPQWYVPLAATLRAGAGPSISTDWLYNASLPALPLALPRRAATTQSVADLLALFDQFGMLVQVLELALERNGRMRESAFGQLTMRYQEWRKDLLVVLDRWMRPLLTPAARSSGQIDERP